MNDHDNTPFWCIAAWLCVITLCALVQTGLQLMAMMAAMSGGGH